MSLTGVLQSADELNGALTTVALSSVPLVDLYQLQLQFSLILRAESTLWR